MVAGLLLASTLLVSDARAQLCQSTQPAAYVASYVPSGNYAAVTAFSPPMVDGVPVVANYAPAVTPVAAMVPTSSIAVTSYYAPQPVRTVATPVTTYYAPTAAAMPVTAYYAAPVATPVATAMPVTAYYAPAAPAMVAPVAAYYPPTVVARRGLFGATRYSYYPGSWYTPY
jgi:hypothetical protein